jgi:adenylate cyclase
MPSAGGTPPQRPSMLRVGAWTVRPDLGLIESESHSSYVRPQVMELLLLLVRGAGGIVTKEEIADAIWHGRFTAESSLTRAVAELRRALGDSPQHPKFIENLPKRGYRLIAEVEYLDAGQPEAPSIAVLPLANLTGAPEDDWLAGGISEEIINTLARLSGIEVVARTSSFAFRDRAADIREIGRALNAQYVLEGAVQNVEGVYRITVQLIRTEDGHHLWSERFDRLAGNLLALEDEIARLTLDRLRVTVTPTEKAQLAFTDTADPDAHALHRLGRYHLGQRTPAAIVEAIRCFEQAVARDPEYAAAWSGLADAYSILAFLGFAAPDEAYPRVKQAAQRALQVNTLLGEAYTSLAAALGIHERKWAEAAAHFERGCQLAPHAAQGHLWFGICLALLGDLDRAWAELAQARRLDPLSMPVLANIGLLLYFMRRNDEAIECYQHVLTLEPGFPLALVHLGRALIQAGRPAEAVEPLKTGAATGFLWPLGFLGMAYGRNGQREEARQVLVQMDRLAPSRYVNPVLRACVHLGLKETEKACGEIEAALAGNDPLITILQVDPLFDGIRAHPRVQRVLEALAQPGVEGRAPGPHRAG